MLQVRQLEDLDGQFASRVPHGIQGVEDAPGNVADRPVPEIPPVAAPGVPGSFARLLEGVHLDRAESETLEGDEHAPAGAALEDGEGAGVGPRLPGGEQDGVALDAHARQVPVAFARDELAHHLHPVAGGEADAGRLVHHALDHDRLACVVPVEEELPVGPVEEDAGRRVWRQQLFRKAQDEGAVVGLLEDGQRAGAARCFFERCGVGGCGVDHALPVAVGRDVLLVEPVGDGVAVMAVYLVADEDGVAIVGPEALDSHRRGAAVDGGGSAWYLRGLPGRRAGAGDQDRQAGEAENAASPWGGSPDTLLHCVHAVSSRPALSISQCSKQRGRASAGRLRNGPSRPPHLQPLSPAGGTAGVLGEKPAWPAKKRPRRAAGSGFGTA